MMTRSAFQGGAASPQGSPARPQRVYTSVADMKRNRAKVYLAIHIAL